MSKPTPFEKILDENMMRIALVILFITSLNLNFFGQTFHSQNELLPQTGISDEEYKFWSDFSCLAPSNILEVIENKTVKRNISQEKENDFLRKIRDYYAKDKISDVTTNLTNDFNLKNNKSYLIERKLPNCENYVLISNADFPGWKDFKVKYPTAWRYRGIARIGFSPDKRQAIMYDEYGCGLTCGSGDFFFLVKDKNDIWNLKIEYNVWLS